MSVFGVILVRICHAFSRIHTEHGEIRSISPYSVRISESAGKMLTRITPNTDTFNADTVGHRSLTHWECSEKILKKYWVGIFVWAVQIEIKRVLSTIFLVEKPRYDISFVSLT